jgi:hypothetical protein
MKIEALQKMDFEVASATSFSMALAVVRGLELLLLALLLVSVADSFSIPIGEAHTMLRTR